MIQASKRLMAEPGVVDDSPTPNLRSYGEIAAMLADRDGSDVSEARVRQICGAAERKIVHALWNDPVARKLLTSGCSSQPLVVAETAHDKADDHHGTEATDHV